MSTIRVVNSGPDTIKVTVNETPKVNVSSPANSVVKVSLGASGSPGSSTFLGLSDTPATFTASKFLKVNSDGNAVEFVDTPAGSSTFLELTDTPPSFTASKFLKVNSTGNAVEFVDTPGGASALNDLSDANTASVAENDILRADSSGVFRRSTLLTEIEALLKDGTTTKLTSDGSGNTSGTSKGKLDLLDASASLRFGITGISMDEASPGDIDFIVATDSSGSTAFTAVQIDGGANANEADFNINNGTTLKIHGASGSAALRYTGSGANVSLPSAGGTLLANVSEDGAPQLGGDLNVNGNKITSASNADILIEPDGTGDINLSADTINLTDNANTGRFEITANEIRLKSTTVGNIWKAKTNGNRFTIEQPLALGSSATPNSTTLLNSKNDNKTHILCENAAGDDKFTVAVDSSGNATTTIADTFIVSGLTYPTSDGTNGQFLTTNGSGTLSFTSGASGDIEGVTAGTGLSGGGSSGSVTLNVEAAQTGITSVVNSSLEIGGDADNRIKFGTSNQIIFRVSGGDGITMKASGEIEATKFDGALEGNADTATALASAVNIGGVSFDGSGNIDLPGVNTAGNQNTSGNAATATALATARNIGGVSFDGTGNIDLPGVNSAGNQNTSGTAAIATTVTVTDNENTNEDNLIAFVAGAATTTGNHGLEMDGDLTYNPSTGRLTATQLAGTLQTAAQSNVTSLGTLTTLTVDNVIVNGTTIGHTDDTDLMTLADGVLTIAGELDATTLDISGNADIDGTLEADAITVNGTALNTVIAGVTVANATTAAVATTVTVTDNESTDEENVITFVAGAAGSGNVGLEADGDLTYNPSSGTVTAPRLNVTENKFTKTSNTTHSHQGDVVFFGGTTGMTEGDLYYYTSTGTWAPANATAASTSGACLLAIALGGVSDTNGMLLRGIYTMDANAIEGTEATGDELYVGEINGHVTSTPPSSTNDVVRVIGYCLDGTNKQIWFNPSNDFIVLA